MNSKTQADVARLLDKVVARRFDQDDISLLFVKLRQFIRSPLLKEVAHYIAHPEERDQGISHREIDLNYQKITRIANNSPSLPLTPVTADFMDLWLYGIAQTEPSFARKYFGGDRQTAKKFVQEAYEQTGDSWTLRASLSVAHRQALSQILHAVFNSLKAKPLFTQQGVITELKDAVNKLGLPRSREYVQSLTALQGDVTACAMCSIQHAPLKLRDGTLASLKWGHCDGGPNLELYAAFRIPYSPPPNGHLNIRVYHFTSEIKVADYVQGDFEESTLFTAARRADGRLVLVCENLGKN